MRKYLQRVTAIAAAFMALLPSLAHAQGAGTVDSGDTAWILMSSALVLLMTPGLAFFYAGMVKSKNVVGTLAQNMVAVAVIGVVWCVIGFSLAFVGDMHGGFIGNADAFLLKDVGGAAASGMTIPFNLFMAFQMMFAIITPALMTGAFAERVNFKAWVIIAVLWSLAVYSPVAHWVWGGGWLADKGALDFAGGFVVHMTAGYSALVAAILIGKRKDTGMKAYDTGMVVLGTALLWFGWFGFNAGSALGANGLAAQAFVTTFISSAVAMLAWMAVDKCKDGHPTLMGGCIGIVAGLVAITPAAGYVTTSAAMIIGLLAGVLCNIAARTVKKAGVDDTLDVFACHGVGGTIGVLSVGLFASSTINSAAANGLFNGASELLKAQMWGVLAVAVYSMVVTFIIIKVVGMITPVRVDSGDETAGLDASQHGEKIQNH